ncbi:MAG TPA: hypothetical protein PKC96_07430 [Bacilli bacterium]|nr:hypothetical protein [Bacilli bacterium]
MIVKNMLRRGFLGFLIGIAVQYILAIAVSLYLRLGYLLPYPASFSERFGGEMSTVVIVTVICGGIGAIVGIVAAWLRSRR